MKTIFKKILATLLVGVIILGTPLTGTTYAMNIQKTKATVYQNTYSQGNKLLSDSQEELSVKLKKIEINDNQFELDFNLQQYGRFHLDGKIEDNLIENISSTNPRLEIVNIFINDNYVNVIMKDKSDYIYVDFNTNQSYDLVRYNPYWYTQVVEKPIETVKDVNLDTSLFAARNAMQNRVIDKNISRSYYIFGEKYVETLVARLDYHWPETLSGDGGSVFEVKLQVANNSTRIDRSNGRVEYYNGSSLYISNASTAIATDKGEYIFYLDTDMQGSKHIFAKLNLGLSYNIPRTPFALSYSFPKNIQVESKYSRKFSAQGYEYVTQMGAEWLNSEGYKIKDTGDFYAIQPTLVEDSANKTYGRKGLKTSWSFEVFSTGENGTGVPAYHTSKMQRYTLFFNY